MLVLFGALDELVLVAFLLVLVIYELACEALVAHAHLVDLLLVGPCEQH